MNPTTEFDHLMKHAFSILYPNGSSRNVYRAKLSDDCYHKAVKPDYTIPGKAWIDFKLTLSYRESHDVAWKPSALYASLRKYIDHVDNSINKLTIIYGNIYGSIKDVHFPITRGNKILIQDEIEFRNKIALIHSLDILKKLDYTEHKWIVDKVREIIRKFKMNCS